MTKKVLQNKTKALEQITEQMLIIFLISDSNWKTDESKYGLEVLEEVKFFNPQTAEPVIKEAIELKSMFLHR